LQLVVPSGARIRGVRIIAAVAGTARRAPVLVRLAASSIVVVGITSAAGGDYTSSNTFEDFW